MKFNRLILANLFRKKARLFLTIGSFAVALFLFAFLSVVNDAFLGASPTQFCTITSASVVVKNDLDMRSREFGSAVPRALW